MQGATPTKIITSGGQIAQGAGGTRYIVVTTKPGGGQSVGGGGGMTPIQVQSGSQMMQTNAQGKPVITIVTSASAVHG